MLGDRNMKYFHALVNNKRNKNHVHKIKLANGNWCEE